MNKTEAQRLLEVTDENAQFEGISRPGMMLRQSLGCALEELDQATDVGLGTYCGHPTLFATVGGEVRAWYVSTTLNPDRNEDF